MVHSKLLRWSKEVYTLRQFHDKFCHRLPKIIMVMSGFYGNSEVETFASDQVMHVQEMGVQRRAIARDYKGRCLSIPVDYPIKFEVIENGKAGKAKYLKDVVEQHLLPCYIRFAKEADGLSFTIDASTNNTLLFGELELKEVYDEKFLKANSVTGDVIYSRIIIVPLYVNITIVVAEGLKDREKDEDMWGQVQDAYARAVEGLDFGRVFGNPNMAMYDEHTLKEVTGHSSDGVYVYIEPQQYVRLKQEPSTDSKTDYKKLYDTVSTYYGAYDYRRRHRDRNEEIPVVLTSYIPHSDTNAGSDEYDFPPEESRCQTPPPPLPSPRTPDASTTDFSKRMPITVDQKSTSSPMPTGLLDQLKDKLKRNPSPQNKDSKPPVQPKPKHQLYRRSRSFDTFTQSSPQNKAAAVQDDDYGDYEEMPLDATRRDLQPAVQVLPSPNQVLVRSARPGNEYSPNPDTHIEGAIRSLDHVPKNISSLSVEQICQCLSLLKLDKYIPGIMENDIDGSLLTELTAEDLENDLHFTPLHAKKLIHFVGGWRPNRA